jgi:Xaa-Pro aminopeptidase
MASSKRIKAGELVTIDMGCVLDGYASDLTRTISIGKADSRGREIHQIVREAQNAAISAARDGMKAKRLDEVARRVIRDAGFGEYFGHGLGHGLGLEVHTDPRVSFISDDILLVGHVFTIEPGIYIPGYGGVRIEDDVYLTESGCEVLTKSSRELIEL